MINLDKIMLKYILKLSKIFIMNYKIATYITAYKDTLVLNQCLTGINNQTYSISKTFIIDNSEKLIINSKNPNLMIKHHPENIGIGAGIKEALEFAIAKNYDFLWTFDQDSIPTPNCLEILLNTYEKLNKEDFQIGIIAPTAIDQSNNKIVEGASFNNDIFMGYTPENPNFHYECDAPITSGSLISLKAAKMIDPPRSDLFIDGVDLDYGYRLKQKGFHNIIVPTAIMYHNFGNPKTVKFFNQELIFQQYSALRHYYICRNHTYLETRFAQNFYKLTSSLKRLKYMIYTIIKIVVYDQEQTLIKIYACLLGTFHGFIGKLGKIWS